MASKPMICPHCGKEIPHQKRVPKAAPWDAENVTAEYARFTEWYEGNAMKHSMPAIPAPERMRRQFWACLRYSEGSPFADYERLTRGLDNYIRSLNMPWRPSAYWLLKRAGTSGPYGVETLLSWAGEQSAPQTWRERAYGDSVRPETGQTRT
uniref:Uncharacterized protein n=1 Tax=viral metagenome TaxID=1070528 RepID=A0A6H1ZSZ7_9ZZZZ